MVCFVSNTLWRNKWKESTKQCSVIYWCRWLVFVYNVLCTVCALLYLTTLHNIILFHTAINNTKQQFDNQTMHFWHQVSRQFWKLCKGLFYWDQFSGGHNFVVLGVLDSLVCEVKHLTILELVPLQKDGINNYPSFKWHFSPVLERLLTSWYFKQHMVKSVLL